MCDHGYGLQKTMFGYDINLPIGAFRMASRSRSGVYFLWAERQGQDYFIHSKLLVSANENHDYNVIADRYVAALSEAIKASPEQYYWRVDPWRLYQSLLRGA